jgi:hypothetical protein
MDPETSVQYAVVWDDNNKRLRKWSSSARYKDKIQSFGDDFSKILQVEPKSFVDKETGERDIGYVAEDLDKIGLNNLVVYDKQGRPDAIKYNIISLYLVEVLKDQARTIQELKIENDLLKERIQALELVVGKK